LAPSSERKGLPLTKRDDFVENEQASKGKQLKRLGN